MTKYVATIVFQYEKKENDLANENYNLALHTEFLLHASEVLKDIIVLATIVDYAEPETKD